MWDFQFSGSLTVVFLRRGGGVAPRPPPVRKFKTKNCPENSFEMAKSQKILRLRHLQPCRSKIINYVIKSARIFLVFSLNIVENCKLSNLKIFSLRRSHIKISYESDFCFWCPPTRRKKLARVPPLVRKSWIRPDRWARIWHPFSHLMHIWGILPR